MAEENGQREVAELLLGRGANDYADKYGWTALIVVARTCQRKVAKVLLEGGADLYKTNKMGQNALFFAKSKPRLTAIFNKYINDVVAGCKSSPRNKTSTN